MTMQIRFYWECTHDGELMEKWHLEYFTDPLKFAARLDEMTTKWPLRSPPLRLPQQWHCFYFDPDAGAWFLYSEPRKLLQFLSQQA